MDATDQLIASDLDQGSGPGNRTPGSNVSDPDPRRASREPLNQQIARTLRNQIQSGQLRDGEVLPSTRALAQEWGCSVYTIDQAMKTLISEGLVAPKSRSMRLVHFPQDQGRHKVRPEVPRLLLVGGFAGSGKTELGRIIARLTGWPILDKDTLTRPVVEAALEILGHSPHDRESTEYLTQIRPREYESLMAAARENAECGNSAVLTAPFIQEFADPAWVQRVIAQFEAIKAQVAFAWIHCDAATMYTYIRQRGAARDAAKLADWPGYLAGIDLDMRPPVPHFLLDNSASSTPLQTQAQDVVRQLLAEQG
jgi:DNA-binding transcriptional regulator YhcF (GntR family)/predicted kinase